MTGRIAVIGTGANGGAVAADLTRAGLDVTLVEQWPANVAAMRRDGLRVAMPGSRFVTPVRVVDVCDVATLRQSFDVVLIMVKAYDVRWAAELIKPLVAPDGLVVGVQNGMTIDAIAEIVGAHRTLGCVIEMGGAMWEPGLVERDTPPSRAWFGIGPYDAHTRGREQQIADVLSHVGTVQVYADIRGAKWMKLVVNCAEVAPTAVLGLPMDEGIAAPGMRRFMLDVGCEAIAVAQRAGIVLTPIFGMPEFDATQPDVFLGSMLDMVVEHFGQPHSKVAALQDWQKGRRSENDDMNGYVVTTAQRLGIDAPLNRHLLDLARRIEDGELTYGMHNRDWLLAAAG